MTLVKLPKHLNPNRHDLIRVGNFFRRVVLRIGRYALVKPYRSYK